MFAFLVSTILLSSPMVFAQEAKETPAVDSKAKDGKGKKSEKKSDAKKAEPKKTTASEGAKGMTKVSMKTSMGTIVFELDKEKAPKTVENFLNYVNAGHYDGTIFHRVIPGFMVQLGGFDEKMSEKSTNKPIENESKNGLKNDRGTIAMARTMDPNSATAQFFINTVNNDFLNFAGTSQPGYAVFGKVVEGMDVVDQISKAKTGQKGMHSDVPVNPIKVETATVVK